MINLTKANSFAFLSEVIVNLKVGVRKQFISKGIN
jgi:hypothetical protein